MNSRQFRTKKKFGQHFLNNKTIATEIVRIINFQDFDQVIEIGPGTGFLTKFIIKECQPILIEIDEEAVQFLKKNFPKINNIIHGDFLKINIKPFLKNRNLIIGNFPYNISTQILFKILEIKHSINIVVGMFQKEVAERICSKPNSKKYGIISVLIQAYYNCEIIMNVEKENFTPPPKVESSVIKLERNNVKKLNCDENQFVHLVKTSFNQRRKKIKNNLKIFEIKSNSKLTNLMEKRPEQLSVSDFILLTNNISKQ